MEDTLQYKAWFGKSFFLEFKLQLVFGIG